MDLLQGNIRKVYAKFLMAAFGSALISSIYGVVDMAMVGQYHGPSGVAAMSVIAPVWNIIYSLGLLTGIGGSVLLSEQKGKSLGSSGNEFFTVSVGMTVLLSILSWIGLIIFETPLLRLFGAEENLLPLASEYLASVKFVVPVFMFNQMLSAFLRNDNAPGLATAAVLSGGVFNIFGDYFFVFAMDMGIAGAGLATATGACISLLVMLAHFFSKKNTLRHVKVHGILQKSRDIAVIGFSTFFIDIAMGILTMMFNRQIIRHIGTDALAVYGVVVNISTFVQCCAYSVGQAAQPIFSINYGARNFGRIKETLKYALYSVAFFGVIWTILIFAFPNGFINIFMTATDSVLDIAPAIMRRYGISFLLLPFNIFSTYYFQSVMKPLISFTVSISRGMVISGVLIYLLPLVAGEAVWLAMPVTELAVAVYVFYNIRKSVKEFPC